MGPPAQLVLQPPPPLLCRDRRRSPIHPSPLLLGTDIQHTESQLRAALKELELLRHEEERQLGQRSSRLQRDYETSMAALERRFLADAQVLQVGLLISVAEERSCWGVMV